MLTVVVFKWFDPHGRYNDHYLYTADMVNTLYLRLKETLSVPHRFVCITDNTDLIHPGVACHPISKSLVSMGYRYPKLSIFNPVIQEYIGGDQFLCLDLDCVITGSLDKYVTDDSFRIWSGTSKNTLYNSSMMLLKKGAFPNVWCEFNVDEAHRVSPYPDKHGSDQVWIQHKLGSKMKTWTNKDGILSFYRDVDRTAYLPDHARIVFFNGGHNPYSEQTQEKHTWIKRCLP